MSESSITSSHATQKSSSGVLPQKMISYEPSPSEYFLFRTAAVCIHEGKVLLMRTLRTKKWFLPGGRNEFFENIEMALKREISEELQCTIDIKRLLWIHEQFFDHADRKTHQIAFYFLTTITSEKDPVTGFPIVPTTLVDGDAQLETAWIPLEDLPMIEDGKIMPFLKTAFLEIPSHPVYVFEPYPSDENSRGAS